MDMPYFNYGLKPEYRAEVALNCATGLHPRLERIIISIMY